jgi:hypothetical protein
MNMNFRNQIGEQQMDMEHKEGISEVRLKSSRVHSFLSLAMWNRGNFGDREDSFMD